MSVWHWVRHGPTHAEAFVGWRDLPADLSDRAAVARLRRHLPGAALIVSSDLSRSISTADAVAGDRQRLPHDPHLREFHFGTWDGAHSSTVWDRHAALSRSYWGDPGHHAPPGGESWNAAAARITAAVARIEAAHPGRDIIAVAHFGAILTQVQAVLGLSARAVLAHKIDNLSVTSLDTGAGRALTINHRP